jgi:ribosomal protein L11 methyltransferase
MGRLRNSNGSAGGMTDTNTTFAFEAGAAAFGDGRHPTTHGVLAALQALDPQAFTPRTACDIGAGSGIISLAIAEKFASTVVAVDIAATAVQAVQENAARNGLSGRIAAYQVDGFDHPAIAAQPPFDLIVMNILAEPLRKLAAPAEGHLASGGVLILSGILQWQEEQIREIYQFLGLELTFRVVIGDWVTLVWQKP